MTTMITAEATDAARQPHHTIMKPTTGTSNPDRPGPMRKMPKARLRRARNSVATTTLTGM